MAEKKKELSPEDQKALDQALATIKRLQGDVPAPSGPAPDSTMLRRFRIMLHGVTWDEKTQKPYDNTTKAMVHDPKTGRAREVTIDRAVVEAYNTADAWQKFQKAWGIRQTDHTPYFREMRTLTEDEKAKPPADVIPPLDPDMMVGVPAPTVLPIRAAM